MSYEIETLKIAGEWRTSGPENKRPCFWCGTLTESVPDDDYPACAEHSLQEVEIGIQNMLTRYPNVGKSGFN